MMQGKWRVNYQCYSYSCVQIVAFPSETIMWRCTDAELQKVSSRIVSREYKQVGSIKNQEPNLNIQPLDRQLLHLL